MQYVQTQLCVEFPQLVSYSRFVALIPPVMLPLAVYFQTQMGGVPCIRGLRVPVAAVIEKLAEGMTPDEILRAYPDLEQEDLSAAPHIASRASVLALFQL